MVVDMHVGQRVRELRERAGLSRRRLDKLSGFSSGFVQQVEKGKGLGSDSAKEIARVFGATLDWLIAGEGDPPTQRQIDRAVAEAAIAPPVRKPPRRGGRVHSAAAG